MVETEYYPSYYQYTIVDDMKWHFAWFYKFRTIELNVWVLTSACIWYVLTSYHCE